MHKASDLNLTLLPEECLFSLRSAFENIVLFFKVEIVTDKTKYAAVIFPMIIPISYLFLLGHHCGKRIRIKNEIGC